MGLKLKKGRNFSQKFSTDKDKAFIINETAAKKFGWKNPIGQSIHMQKTVNGTYLVNGKVIGVVNDFHYDSFHEVIQPLIIRLSNCSLSSYENGFLLLKITGKNTGSTINYIKNIYSDFDPVHPLEYFFIDAQIQKQYLSEEKLNKIFTAFSLLTIFISIIGLFGIASFTLEQKTKEIGIRKVLGANILSLLKLFNKEFLKPVLIAIIFSWPIAYYIMNKWLENFAYRIDMNWWIFILSGGIALVSAFVIISFRVIKAAAENPINSLRYE